MADGSIPVTPGAGASMRALTNTGVQGGAFQQVMSIAGPDGSLVPFDPDGTLQVSPDSRALFFDAFDATLTNFTTGGTAPTISAGMLTFASSTTASGSSYIRTNGTFLLRPQAYLRMGSFVQLGETTTAITNNTRWWGYGQNQGTPTAANPVLNGAVFMIDYSDGSMRIAVYSAGTRTQSQTITRPTDGALHKYEIWWRQAVVYFVIDGVTVGSITYPNTAVTSGMYIIGGSTNYTNAPGTAPVLRMSSASMADTSGTNGTLSDGVNPYLQATVKTSGTAISTADFPLVVGVHPSSPTPAGTNTIGYVGINPSLGVSAYSTVTASSATFFANIKASAGSLLELTVSNTTTTAAFVKLYNLSAAPTSSSTPIATFRLAASGNAGDTVNPVFGALGKRFTTGIGIGITGAVGPTDGTATVAGLQIYATYV